MTPLSKYSRFPFPPKSEKLYLFCIKRSLKKVTRRNQLSRLKNINITPVSKLVTLLSLLNILREPQSKNAKFFQIQSLYSDKY